MLPLPELKALHNAQHFDRTPVWDRYQQNLPWNITKLDLLKGGVLFLLVVKAHCWEAAATKELNSGGG